MNLNTETFPVEVSYAVPILKASENPRTGDWVVEGFVATADLDLQGDVITESGLKEGAETLNEAKTLLWNHDVNQPIGKLLLAKVKDNGIWVRAVVDKTSEMGQQVWKWVKEGIISRFSIRGDALASTKGYIKGKLVNLLTKLRLIEASLVTLPANPKAEVMNWYVAKSFEGYYRPIEEFFHQEVIPLVSTETGFEGTVEVGKLAGDVAEGIEASPTVCKNSDSNPVGVVEEVAKIDDGNLYLKIRYASSAQGTEGGVFVRGKILKSGNSEVLGFLPRGVWILDKETAMNKNLEGAQDAIKQLSALGEQLKGLQDQFAKMTETISKLKVEEPKVEQHAGSTKAQMPEEEEKECKPLEEKAQMPPEEKPTEEPSVKATPKEEEKPPEEPSTMADKPEEKPMEEEKAESPKEEKYPLPEPKNRDEAKSTLKRVLLLAARALSKGQYEDIAKKLEGLSEAEMEELSKNLLEEKKDNTPAASSDSTAILEAIKSLQETISQAPAFQKGDSKGGRVEKKGDEIPWTSGLVYPHFNQEQ